MRFGGGMGGCPMMGGGMGGGMGGCERRRFFGRRMREMCGKTGVGPFVSSGASLLSNLFANFQRSQGSSTPAPTTPATTATPTPTPAPVIPTSAPAPAPAPAPVSSTTSAAPVNEKPQQSEEKKDAAPSVQPTQPTVPSSTPTPEPTPTPATPTVTPVPNNANKQPQKLPHIPPKFAAHINSLSEMGFTDVAMNLYLLEMNKGNVQSVLRYLLGEHQ